MARGRHVPYEQVALSHLVMMDENYQELQNKRRNAARQLRDGNLE